jgi:tetratricopeptide (TPR) repeat protein
VHLNRALIMLKAVKNIPNLAIAYQVIARVHYREWRLPEALDAIQEAWKLVESGSDPNAKALISLESGLIHFSANRDTEAWKLTEIALMQASQYGDRLTVARALDLMGHGYLRRGDYDNAYGAYEAAAEKYRGTVNADRESVCKDNMARIKMKQRNPDAEVGFYRLHMDPDKSLFYPLLKPLRATTRLLVRSRVFMMYVLLGLFPHLSDAHFQRSASTTRFAVILRSELSKESDQNWMTRCLANLAPMRSI